ncbi:nuclear transport factor 2 family protein [Streptomyces cinnamoneus]|uniref:ester cyclase n=1 Tax=Streptomyces cinnamoneus TaxID=53446 RepID=UPI0034478603
MSSNSTYMGAFVQEGVDAYNAQDFGRLGALYADDVNYTCAPFQLAFTGRDAFVGHVKEYAGAVPDRKLTVRQVIADGDTVAVEYSFTGTSSGVHPGLPPEGEPVRAGFCSVLRLREGQIASQADYLGGE